MYTKKDKMIEMILKNLNLNKSAYFKAFKID